MGVYKLKEEHAKKEDRNIRERKKAQTEQEERKKAKELYRLRKQNDRCASSEPSIYVRVNLFIQQKLIQFLTPTLYKLYCLGLFTCEPSIVLGRYKSCPYMHYFRMSDTLFSRRVMKYPYSAAYYLKINNKYFPLPLNRIRFEIYGVNFIMIIIYYCFSKKEKRLLYIIGL